MTTMLATYAGALPCVPDMVDFILVPDHGPRCDPDAFAACRAAAASKVWKQSGTGAGIFLGKETPGTHTATGVKDSVTSVDANSPHILQTASRSPASSTAPPIRVRGPRLRTLGTAFEKARPGRLRHVRG